MNAIDNLHQRASIPAKYLMAPAPNHAALRPWRFILVDGDAHIKRALDLAEHDRIVGFLHMGTSSIPVPAVKRPDPARFVERWTWAS